jgi:hypothetical protein
MATSRRKKRRAKAPLSPTRLLLLDPGRTPEEVYALLLGLETSRMPLTNLRRSSLGLSTSTRMRTNQRSGGSGSDYTPYSPGEGAPLPLGPYYPTLPGSPTAPGPSQPAPRPPQPPREPGDLPGRIRL